MANSAFCCSSLPPALSPLPSTNFSNLNPRNPIRFNGSSNFKLRCSAAGGSSSHYAVLGVDPSLSTYTRSEIIERECMDPFDKPECEAFDIFVNEVVCIGKGCPYSCVERAPQAFAFSSIGTARARSQGHSEDYQVQMAAGQCPRSCIHFVTPSQRIVLEEELDIILNAHYDCSAETELLYSLIVKARYENNRFQKPKKKPKTSTQHVDCY
ncbi:hypothetical protein LINPERPRIM_LOCUS44034 [Linum perenne]